MAARPPEAAQRLLAAHNQLVTASPTLDHPRVVAALERLADALELIAPERAEDILRVRQSAIELARSDDSALIHADLVRAGLEAASRVLADAGRDVDDGSIHALRLQEAAAAVANATAAIDVDAPLLPQYGYVRVAFREATRAVFAAIGADEPAVLVYTARR